jgi:hypothetical protein
MVDTMEFVVSTRTAVILNPDPITKDDFIESEN